MTYVPLMAFPSIVVRVEPCANPTKAARELEAPK